MRDSRILAVEGIVLSRADLGEADRLSVVYAESLGKLGVRFTGVKRPRAKMGALSEPLVRVEFRLHLGPRSPYGKAVGGKLLSSYPSVRADLRRTMEALCLCEMLDRLTPELSPNPEKYRLLAGALDALEAGPIPWLVPAFGLRLLALAGVGLRGVPPAGLDPALWSAAHDLPLEALRALAPDRPAAARLLEAARGAIEAQAGRALRALAFVELAR